MKEKLEAHALKLGKVVGNLQTIELLARQSIAKLDRSHQGSSIDILLHVKEAEFVDYSPITDKNDLGQTLGRYNRLCPVQFKIDAYPIIKLRDAIAHGRVFGMQGSQSGMREHLRLIKFEKKQSGRKVRVEHVIDMTPEWFSKTITTLEGAIENLRHACDMERRPFK